MSCSALGCPSGWLNSIIGGRSLSGWMLFLGGLFGSPAGWSYSVAWGYLCSVRLLLGCLALLSGKVFLSATMVLLLAGLGGTW